MVVVFVKSEGRRFVPRCRSRLWFLRVRNLNFVRVIARRRALIARLHAAWSIDRRAKRFNSRMEVVTHGTGEGLDKLQPATRFTPLRSRRGELASSVATDCLSA